LSRFAGVSAARARRRNPDPEPGEGEGPAFVIPESRNLHLFCLCLFLPSSFAHNAHTTNTVILRRSRRICFSTHTPKTCVISSVASRSDAESRNLLLFCLCCCPVSLRSAAEESASLPIPPNHVILSDPDASLLRSGTGSRRTPRVSASPKPLKSFRCTHALPSSRIARVRPFTPQNPRPASPAPMPCSPSPACQSCP